MLSYWAVKLLSHFVCLLPHRAAMMIGAGLARLLWPFIPARRKRLAQRQVERCLRVSPAEAAYRAGEYAALWADADGGAALSRSAPSY